MTRLVCLASETSVLTFQRLNIKGVNQFVRNCKIVCTYVVGMKQSQVCYFLGQANIASKSRNAGTQTRMAPRSLQKCTILIDLFVSFDSLRPINNLSVI